MSARRGATGGSVRRVLVIGGGVAGASAAIAAARTGADVLIVAGVGSDAATAHAQGGIAAAIGVGDSPAAHAADTARAAAGMGDARAIDVLTREGADRVLALIADGLAVDRHADGRVALGLEAAHDRARIVHAGGDRSGAVLADHLTARVLAMGIEVLSPARMVELVVRNDAVTGAIVAGESGTLQVIDADAVVLATGGFGRCYSTTSTPRGATGGGILAAWDAGAQLADLEFVQFHPTTLAVPAVTAGAGAFLISEAVRGHGAVIVDEAGRRFLFDDDPRGELAPRDVVAAAIARRIAQQHGRPVFLDATAVARRDGADALRRRFPTIDAAIAAHGLDLTRDEIPVAPAAHFTMGGIRTDLHGRTSVPGLLAAGECARSGVHGANRLASNSLLEGLVFGSRAGTLAAAGDLAAPRWDAEVVDDTVVTSAPTGDSPDVDATRAIIGAGIGIEREEAGLRAAVAALASVAGDPRASAVAISTARLGRLVGEAALRREESRGAHRRSDHPITDPSLAAPIALVRRHGAAAPATPQPAGSIHEEASCSLTV